MTKQSEITESGEPATTSSSSSVPPNPSTVPPASSGPSGNNNNSSCVTVSVLDKRTFLCTGNFPDDEVGGGGDSDPQSLENNAPFAQKSYNSAQDTIYLCNFRVSVDGDWLCLRQLEDVEVPMQRPPSYYETLPPSPEFIPFYGLYKLEYLNCSLKIEKFLT